MNCAKVMTWTLVAALLIGMAGAAFAADERGYEIAARSDRTDLGFGDSEVELQMVLRNAAGQRSTRVLRIATLEKPDESVGDKSLVVEQVRPVRWLRICVRGLHGHRAQQVRLHVPA